MKKNKYRQFYQKLFDLTFKSIETNMREMGYGDVSTNKAMKSLIRSFYTVLLFCENYEDKKMKSKENFFFKYLEKNINQKKADNMPLIKYFNDYKSFCFDLSPDSVLKGDLNFNYK